MTSDQWVALVGQIGVGGVALIGMAWLFAKVVVPMASARATEIVTALRELTAEIKQIRTATTAEHAEITAALTGDNSLGLRLIPRTHPAINAAGELVDRWGTPFLFHALAGDRMEVRSAGPDKKFGTPDDARLTPPPPPGGEPLL